MSESRAFPAAIRGDEGECAGPADAKPVKQRVIYGGAPPTEA